MRTAMWLVVFVLGCASSRNRGDTIPEEGIARWNACRTALEALCHDYAHGDPAQESQCNRNTQREYAELETDEARSQYLVQHRCNATP